MNYHDLKNCFVEADICSIQEGSEGKGFCIMQ